MEFVIRNSLTVIGETRSIKKLLLACLWMNISQLDIQRKQSNLMFQKSTWVNLNKFSFRN